ncbi:ParB/RepB/Spo0J family partition protein [Geminicoccus roseus]|uniref:ParB/RepB/Spo0J family partition protein n=1 Tax=Geminicoccus roseus TaxID=404900 RepID=UPI00041C289B|nr:ParB/RepB/Spo0J family partition protein [Geminicoccus roseus]
MKHDPDHPAVRRRGLGMGLSALLGEDAGTIFDGDEQAARPTPKGSRVVPIEQLTPSAHQPRRSFDEDELESLADSMRRHGLLQPLLVRPKGDQGYEIVAGERRWRAAQRAGLDEVPVLIRELGERETLEIALVENVQRKDLSPLEEADAYRRLTDEFGHTQEDIASVLGRSRSHVANTIRLLALPPAVARLLEDDKLTAGHARALLGAQDPAKLAQTVVDEGLNVRQTEELVRRQAADVPGKAATRRMAPDADVQAFEERLSRRFGLPIAIRQKKDGGELVVRWRTLDQLDRFLNLVGSEEG